MEQREKRVTAGRRMTTLVGKALEDDEAFWGHETWKDDDASDNESFHSSDEDSSLRQDEFDSDFNDSESEMESGHDEEQVAQEQQVERDLQQQERKHQKQQQLKRSYVDVKSSSVRPTILGKGKTKLVGGRKAVTGDGLNAGIVLNLPSSLRDGVASVSIPLATTAQQHPGTAVIPAALVSSSSGLPSKVVEAPSTTTATVAAVSAAQKKVELVRSIARTRQRRSITKPKRAAAQQQQPGQSTSTTVAAPPSPTTSLLPLHKRKKRRHQQSQQQSQSQQPPPRQYLQPSLTSHYTQEQLLLEAVHETEPENERWLLARKRRMQDVEQTQEQLDRLQQQQMPKGTIIEKFVSRRGHLNIITFPEMDHVPTIFTPASQSSVQTEPPPMLCVITGKPARYRDPKTGFGYYDIASFREIRRRLTNGEPIVLESDQTNGSSNATATNPNSLPTSSLHSATVATSVSKPSYGVAPPESSTSASKPESAPLRIHIRAPMTGKPAASNEPTKNPDDTTEETKLNSSPAQPTALLQSDGVTDAAHPIPSTAAAGDSSLGSAPGPPSNPSLEEHGALLVREPLQPSHPMLNTHTEQSVNIALPTATSNGSTEASATASSTSNELTPNPTSSMEPMRIPRKASFHSQLPEPPQVPKSATTLAVSVPSHTNTTMEVSSDRTKGDVERVGKALPSHVSSSTSSNTNNMLPDPPASPRRSSPRRHKPSAKLLENAANMREE